MAFDLILSSGFLAFARQSGFLKAVEESKLPVRAICGTSSGALAGSLWAAGHRAEDIFALLTKEAPLKRLRPQIPPWKGLFSMQPLIDELKPRLPAYIEELPMPFGVGVIDSKGQHQILTRGPLPEAVAASCAMPRVFRPISIEGVNYADGGAADRLGYAAWQAQQGQNPSIVHWVERSYGPSYSFEVEPDYCVKSPKSGAKLWSLGDTQSRFQESYQKAKVLLPCEI